ncbi:alpha-hydroxy-acid oxidizing protein [Bradyrhizobium arachidis]|uniref:alpha-hydroxy acid oxidase n=1 Tax=Bradyrhizobium arachidis TaxID=858423 RepID=UPI0021631A79|nr:alpha-hydroxy acid oxidase [Bradyrhizobium arachidis]UVO35801.1 alpha-hydroxy-acid oxidizing protein [Bradyrhizobium arachidis]
MNEPRTNSRDPSDTRAKRDEVTYPIPEPNSFLNYAELRQLARRRLPRIIFDFIDRGTEDEHALRRNRNALDSVRIRPRALRGGGVRNQATSLFGQNCDTPIIVAPTAFAGLVWYQGELELAKAAAANGMPFCAATEALTPVEEIAAASNGPIWFQLYLWEKEEFTRDLLERVWSSGVRTLLVTCDNSVSANREYNIRSGFGMPLRYSTRNLCDVAFHPRWALGVFARYLATGSVPTFANYPAAYRSSILSRNTKALRYQPIGWDHIRWIRDLWKGNLILKGILRADDAILGAKLGADGVVVSNHGGRNLDGAVAPIEVLAEIVDAVGKQLTVIADSGVQRGSDILKLLAVGAKAVMIGRGLLYATAVGGSSGASRMVGILQRELDIALGMSGCNDIGELDRSLIEMPGVKPMAGWRECRSAVPLPDLDPIPDLDAINSPQIAS